MPLAKGIVYYGGVSSTSPALRSTSKLKRKQRPPASERSLDVSPAAPSIKRSRSEGTEGSSRAASATGMRPQMPSLARQPSEGKRLVEHKMAAKFKKGVSAVRGPIAMKATAYRARLLQKGRKAALPFEHVLECHMGNPQAVGHPPLTYVRQTLALLDYPPLLDNPAAAALFPADLLERARTILQHMPAGIGAYTETQGARYVRQRVAEFIETRDGHPSSADEIFLTDGASAAMRMILSMVVRNETDAVVVPQPQYPGYSSITGFVGGQLACYRLIEEGGWRLDVDEVRRALTASRARGHSPRALVVINPGNPTGNVLGVEEQRALVRLCVEERLVLLADEVYQANVWTPKPFFSFKKVVADMGVKPDQLELFSLHSASKGLLGECGRRGGYVECFGIGAAAKAAMYKELSLGLCSNAAGQATLELMLHPPQPGAPSFETYAREREEMMASFPRRARLFCDAFNSMEGVSCQPAEGAFYLFPRLELPARARARAAERGVEPDAMYAEELLDATGICLVPGSGFKQDPGTHHLRITFLPREEHIAGVIGKLRDFHAAFMATWRDGEA